MYKDVSVGYRITVLNKKEICVNFVYSPSSKFWLVWQDCFMMTHTE